MMPRREKIPQRYVDAMISQVLDDLDEVLREQIDDEFDADCVRFTLQQLWLAETTWTAPTKEASDG